MSYLKRESIHSVIEVMQPLHCFSSVQFSSVQFSSVQAYVKLAYQIAKFCHPVETKKSNKVFFRSLFFPKISYQWYCFIANSNLLSELVQQKKQLAEKPHRHQLRLDIPIKQRLKLLIEHYTVLEKLFEASFLRQVLLNQGAVISRVEISPDEIFELVLKFGGNESKEGELAIIWRLNGQKPLAKIRFSLLPKQDNQIDVYIAGLQGAQGENRRERVAEASKLMSGLSPSRIVLEGCLAFANAIKAETVLCVADNQQISKSKLNKHFSYDDYWLDVGGVVNQQGDYEIPLVIQRKLKEDTPRKRRAKYRRQHEFLDIIFANGLELLQSRLSK
jgi:uncharacterized protein VirK/YbjX